MPNKKNKPITPNNKKKKRTPKYAKKTQIKNEEKPINPYTGNTYHQVTPGIGQGRKGRPTRYSPEIAHEICTKLAEGQPLRKILRESDHLPAMSRVMSWLSDVRYQDFWDQYRRAREAQMEVVVDETILIADETEDPRHAKVQIEARQWLAGKLKPKKYGDIKQIDLSGSVHNVHHLGDAIRKALTGKTKPESLLIESVYDQQDRKAPAGTQQDDEVLDAEILQKED